MADVLATASSWLAQQRRRFTSHAVSYRRGDLAVDVPATLGQSTIEFESAAGVLQQFEARDFLIEAADLVLGGQAAAPLPGDRIVDGMRTFQVLDLGGLPCYRPSDPYGITLRIHTKEVS